VLSGVSALSPDGESGDGPVSEALALSQDVTGNRDASEALTNDDSDDTNASEALARSPGRGSLRASLTPFARCLRRRGRGSPLALRVRQEGGWQRGAVVLPFPRHARAR